MTYIYTCSVSVTGKEYYYRQHKNDNKSRVSIDKIKGEKPTCMLSEKALLAKSLQDIDRLTIEKNQLEAQLQDELAKQKMLATKTISDNEQKIIKLQQEKSESANRLKGLKKSSQTEREDLLQQISRLDSAILTMNMRNNQLNEEIIQNQNLIQAVTSEKKSLEITNSGLSSDLLEARNLISRHISEKEKLQSELYMKEESFSQLILVSNAGSETIVTLENELSILREEMRLYPHERVRPS